MLQMRHHTSRLLLAAATLLAAFAFSSCERDKYLDWKYINQSWYDEHKNDEGWHTTESGLMYRVIYDGIGDLKPGMVLYEKYETAYITPDPGLMDKLKKK